MKEADGKTLHSVWVDSSARDLAVGMYHPRDALKGVDAFWAEDEHAKLRTQRLPNKASRNDPRFRHFQCFGFCLSPVDLPPGTVFEVVDESTQTVVRQATLQGMVFGQGNRKEYSLAVSFSGRLTCSDVESLLGGSFFVVGESDEESMRTHVYGMQKYHETLRGFYDPGLFCSKNEEASKSCQDVMQEWRLPLQTLRDDLGRAYMRLDVPNPRDYLRALAAVDALQGQGIKPSTEAAAAPLLSVPPGSKMDRAMKGNAILQAKRKRSAYAWETSARRIDELVSDVVEPKQEKMAKAHNTFLEGFKHTVASHPGGIQEMYNAYPSFLRAHTGASLQKD